MKNGERLFFITFSLLLPPWGNSFLSPVFLLDLNQYTEKGEFGHYFPEKRSANRFRTFNVFSSNFRPSVTSPKGEGKLHTTNVEHLQDFIFSSRNIHRINDDYNVNIYVFGEYFLSLK